MPGFEAIFVAVEPPGTVIFAQPAVLTISLPTQPSVGHSDESSPSPFCLPVAAPGQPLRAQHLRPAIEPLWVIRMWLLSPISCLPVSLREKKVSVCCVWVQDELFGI